MQRFIRATAVALPFFVAANGAGAADHWICGLSADAVRLVCVADADPHEAGVRSPPTAVVNGTVFPLDARRQYTVDLWSPPTEMDFVERLAFATICYRSPGCTVELAVAGAHVARADAGRR